MNPLNFIIFQGLGALDATQCFPKNDPTNFKGNFKFKSRENKRVISNTS